jgi:hypothetical protein
MLCPYMPLSSPPPHAHQSAALRARLSLGRSIHSTGSSSESNRRNTYLFLSIPKFVRLQSRHVSRAKSKVDWKNSKQTCSDAKKTWSSANAACYCLVVHSWEALQNGKKDIGPAKYNRSAVNAKFFATADQTIKNTIHTDCETKSRKII